MIKFDELCMCSYETCSRKNEYWTNEHVNKRKLNKRMHEQTLEWGENESIKLLSEKKENPIGSECLRETNRVEAE